MRHSNSPHSRPERSDLSAPFCARNIASSLGSCPFQLIQFWITRTRGVMGDVSSPGWSPCCEPNPVHVVNKCWEWCGISPDIVKNTSTQDIAINLGVCLAINHRNQNISSARMLHLSSASQSRAEPLLWSALLLSAAFMVAHVAKRTFPVEFQAYLPTYSTADVSTRCSSVMAPSLSASSPASYRLMPSTATF